MMPMERALTILRIIEIGKVECGDIAPPEIRYTFVKNAVKVRDLLDSMHKGFPVAFCCSGKVRQGQGPVDRTDAARAAATY